MYSVSRITGYRRPSVENYALGETSKTRCNNEPEGKWWVLCPEIYKLA